MNKTALVASAAVLALLTAACSGGDDDTTTGTIVSPADTTLPDSLPSTTDAPSTTTTSTTEALPTIGAPDIPRMPLTGEPIDDPSEVPDRPALVVKLSNAGPTATPQAGLNSADIVVEEVINDFVTRLAAVFHSTGADPVGPVRSGRAQDINVMLAFQSPLFAWSGGNASVTRSIRESDLVNLDARYEPGFYRRSSRRSPNNLYSSTDALWDQTTDDAGRPSVVFPYLEPGEEPGGEPATQIYLTFDNYEVRWGYDPETGRYYRHQNGSPHNTEESDGVEQVWADSIVVMLADYGINVFDGNPDAQVLGSNPVMVFTGGTVQEGIWLRFQPADPFGLFDNLDDLNELEINPGRTWLEIPRKVDGTVTWGLTEE